MACNPALGEELQSGFAHGAVVEQVESVDVFYFAAEEKIEQAGARERLLTFGERRIAHSIVDRGFFLNFFYSRWLAGGRAVFSIAWELAWRSAGTDADGADADAAACLQVRMGARKFNGAGDHPGGLRG